MEVVLKVNGKEKVYKQSTTTFKTMQKALEYQKLLSKQARYFEKIASAGITENIDEDDIDPMKDLYMAVELIVAYFDGQFTYDDFVNAEFEDINDIYVIAFGVMQQILGAKMDEEQSKKATSQQTK